MFFLVICPCGNARSPAYHLGKTSAGFVMTCVACPASTCCWRLLWVPSSPPPRAAPPRSVVYFIFKLVATSRLIFFHLPTIILPSPSSLHNTPPPLDPQNTAKPSHQDAFQGGRAWIRLSGDSYPRSCLSALADLTSLITSQAQLKLVVAGMAAAGLSMRQAEKLWHEGKAHDVSFSRRTLTFLALSVWPDEAEDTIIESGDEGTSDWRVPKFEFVTPTKKGGSKNGTPNKKRKFLDP